MNEKKTERKLIAVTHTEVQQVEDWRKGFEKMPSWSEAARRLIQKGLEADKSN